MRSETNIRRNMRKKKRERMLAAIRAVWLMGLLGLIVICIHLAETLLPEQAGEKEAKKVTAAVEAVADPAMSKISYTVEAPVKRELPQIYAQLEKMADEDETAAEIYDSYSSYTEPMLAAFVNNPEMGSFIIGTRTADGTVTGGLTDEEKEAEYPLLLQWDRRWGYAPYGESIIGLSGCGPTCLSMALVTLRQDKEMTPDKVADFSAENGYYVQGSGTAWALMSEGAAQLGLNPKELSLSEEVMKAELDAGHPIICTMGPGDFTTEGHYILLYDYDGSGFYVNDPNCIYRSSRTWSYEELKGQIKNLWSYTG